MKGGKTAAPAREHSQNHFIQLSEPGKLLESVFWLKWAPENSPPSLWDDLIFIFKNPTAVSFA